MSNLQLRVISAIVLAAAVLAVTWYGGAAFRLIAAVITLGIFFEWSQMSQAPEDRAWAKGGLSYLPELLILVMAAAIVAGLPAATLLAVLAAVCVATAVLSAARGGDQWPAAGLAYAGLSGFALSLLRGDDRSGLYAILFLFATVWATDIFAYFVGRAVGGPKLAPAISPGKTWSGAAGGTVAGVVAAVAVAVALESPQVALLGAAAVFLSVVSQIGDLFESWVKRRHGVKDSGWLIPGHGGVMDRVDGLVVAALALYIVGAASGGGLDWPAGALFPR
ncbi:MAG: phosphatidate cytidylyltransferase [Rhizobiaceae bacterium]|nr:phosphatidate cytidylyltransferase [Rhizobiaceae bacterium]